MYYCPQCERRHRETSKIGINHRNKPMEYLGREAFG